MNNHSNILQNDIMQNFPVTFEHFLCFRFDVDVLDGVFSAEFSRPTGWTDIVLNYVGPNDGQGIRVYYDGVEVVNDTT